MVKYKHFLASIFMVLTMSVVAQVNQQVLIQGFEPTQTTTRESLLNWIQIITQGNTNSNVRIRVKLGLPGGNQIYAIEAVGEVKPGMTPASDLSIVSSSVLDRNFDEIVRELGYLPDANYLFCAELLDQQGSKECYSYRFKNSALLEQVYPFNAEAVEINRPYFNWLYTQFTSGTTFNIICKEKREGQSNLEAIEQNPIWFAVKHHPSLFLPYPQEIDPIQENSQYVWQVEVMLNNKVVGRSEIWSFYLKKEEKLLDYPISRSYVDVDNLSNPPSLYILGDLKFKTVQKQNTGRVQVKIYNENGKLQRLTEHKELNVELGDNYYVLHLADIANLKHLGNYRCVLESPLFKNEKVVLYFMYLDPETASGN